MIEVLTLATFYAHYFTGRPTASGETFRNDRYTAAHRKLPFGTCLRVTNPKTKAFVYVRVTDRGPFSKAGLDLSQAAFKKIAPLRQGVVKVSYTEVTKGRCRI